MDLGELKQIFEPQLKSAHPLQESDLQIVNKRDDYFGHQLQIGEYLLYVGIRSDEGLNIVGISSSSLEKLGDEKVFLLGESQNPNLPIFYIVEDLRREILKHIDEEN